VDPGPPPVDRERQRRRERAPPSGLTAENLNGRLLELNRRLSESPSTAMVRAIHATALEAYNLDGASARDSALAARVVGDALGQLGEPAECVRWAQISLDIRPTDSARRLLDACREVRR
jgi:hypothetical protein